MDSGISYIHSPLKVPLMYSTVLGRLKTFAEKTPTKEAVVVYDLDGNRSSITCFDLLQKSCCFARGLIQLGIKKGDIIASSLLNGPNWMICTFGIQIAGCVPLLFKFYRHDGTDISKALEKSGCTAIIFDPGNNNVNLKISRCFIQSIRGEGVKSEQVPSLKFMILSRNPDYEGNLITINEILKCGENAAGSELPNIDPDDLAAILLSSGSTGTPKPIQFTHINLLEVGRRHCEDAFYMKDNDKYYNGNSFNWGGAYPHMFLFKGTTRVTCSDALSFRSIEEANNLITSIIHREQCTSAMISVASIQEIIQNDSRSNYWASTLKTIAVAGLPIPSFCSKILHKVGEKIIPMYGATEIGSISQFTVLKGENHEDYCVGTPLSGMEVKIISDTGEVLPLNVFGEVYVRDCIPHLGYHKDKELTEKVYQPTGWYKTDDIGCIRENGTLIITGRKSDMLIIGGELVSPTYLERVIRKYPGVRDVVVVPIADEGTFQQACACIIPMPGQRLSEDDMKKCVQDEFAIISEYRGFAPKFYLFFDEFPTTAVGKISRTKIRQLACGRLG